MTFTALVLAFAIAVALYVKLVLSRRWRRGIKFAAVGVLALPPAIAWWMAFSSPGSGWGFALIAFGLSAIIAFGGALGALLRSN